MNKIESIRENVKSQLSKLDLKIWLECHVTIEGVENEIELDKIPKAIINWLEWVGDKNGWPIGIILPPSEFSNQQFTENTFTSEVIGTELYSSYDYSYFSTNGTIYLVSTLNENKNISFEYKIKRMTELLFFIRQYYVFWIISHDLKINIDLKLNGIPSFQKFYSENNLIPPTEEKYKLLEIKVKTNLYELLYHFRNEAFKVLSEMFTHIDLIPDQEIKVKKWIDEYINSIRS